MTKRINHKTVVWAAFKGAALGSFVSLMLPVLGVGLLYETSMEFALFRGAATVWTYALFLVWFPVMLALGWGALSYSVESGRIGPWGWACIFAGSHFVLFLLGAFDISAEGLVAVFFASSLQVVGPLIGFAFFWNEADPDGLYKMAARRRQGLPEKEEPADWALEAARRIAEKSG